MISRGGKSTGINAKNYIGKEADARLQEVIQPIQQQGLNALNVDWVSAEYFQLLPSNMACTCRQVQVTRQEQEAKVATNPTMRSALEVEIDWKRPSFGTRNETPQHGDDFTEDDLTIVDDDNTENTDAIGTSSHLFTATEDCGICFRSGVVPGYTSYNRQRVLLCTHHIEDLDGYHLEKHRQPNVMSPVMDDAFVEFQITVPKYFNSVRCGLWQNKELVVKPASSYLQLGASKAPVSLWGLKNYAGKTVTLRVVNEEFTHLVLDFDLGLPPVHVNFAQMSKSTDWTMLDTLGQINIILPMTIAQVSSADVVYVPSRKQTFKVTDVTYLQTARNAKLDWSAQTRIVQPNEALHNLRKGGLILE